jgi:exosortase
MTSTRPTAGSGSYLPYLLLFLPLGCVVWAFWPTLTELFHVWSSDPQYSHGFLVPVFAAFLLWMRRDMLKPGETRPTWWDAMQPRAVKAASLTVKTNELRPSWAGLPVLAFGIALHLYAGYFGGYDTYTWLDSVALVPCVAGLWIIAGGLTAWRWGWPGIAFLLFMIPLPYRYAIALSGPLQHMATISSTFVMQAIGLPALSDGNVISVDDAQINVVEACSGLRMLVVFFALSAAVAIVSRRPLLDRLIVLASAVPIAIVSNILRVTAAGVLHHTTTTAAADTFFHDLAGWLMMPLGLGLLWLELKILSALFIARPVSPPVRVAREPVARRTPTPTRTPWQRSTKQPAVMDRPAENREPVAAKPEAESQVSA